MKLVTRGWLCYCYNGAAIEVTVYVGCADRACC